MPRGRFRVQAYPFSGRYEVCTRSPLTGIWGEASSGGWVGPYLKRTGYDAVIVKGRSSGPVYLLVTDRSVEIRDASYLWGKDAYETEAEIKKELKNPDVKVACIGQGGENLVKFSGIMNDGGRTAGRCGVGAVWAPRT